MAFGDKKKDEKGPSNTPPEGQGDQGHGAGDPGLTAQEGQARTTSKKDNVDKEYEPYDVQGRRAEGLFQSDEARRALENPELADEFNKSDIKLAKIGPEQVEQVEPVDQAKLNKLVKVKPRQTVARFRVGEDWYQVEKDKEVLVPRHIAQLLEEKGII